jgi:hypothetical protein
MSIINNKRFYQKKNLFKNEEDLLEYKYRLLMHLPINKHVIGLYVKVGKNTETHTYGKIVGFDEYNRCLVDISDDIFEERIIKLPVFWGNLEDIHGIKLESKYALI